MPKKTASKKASKGKSKSAAPHSITIKLTAAQQKQAQKCLERSGKITLRFKEISVTRLPRSLSSSTAIID